MEIYILSHEDEYDLSFTDLFSGAFKSIEGAKRAVEAWHVSHCLPYVPELWNDLGDGLVTYNSDWYIATETLCA